MFKLMENVTFSTDFYIIAFSDVAGNEVLLFVAFGLLYLISILWNMVIITVTYIDPHLQSPMYFFLCNLSFVDVLYTSVTLPKLLDITITGNSRVPFTACFAQLFFFTSMACTEIFLLTAMACDRYIAICIPLLYTVLMRKRNCILLVAGSWISGYSNSLFVTVFASYLSFCGSRNINQLFCDIKTLTKISCSGTGGFQAMIYIESFVIGLCPFLLILMSYGKIISNILKIRLAQKRSKTFSTCTSHLTVLLIFYGTLLCMYMRPSSENSDYVDKIFAALYLAVTPTLNPLIYSIRNNEIKNVIKKILTLQS